MRRPLPCIPPLKAGCAAIRGPVRDPGFDLIGFGQNGSRLTLSDVRVSGLPQLQDEAATMLEDGSLAFDPYVQADAQLRPMLAANVVDAPLHGAITVNGDGSVNSTAASAASGLPTFGAFSYTPDLDYAGSDSFTYRLADGPLESNLATVSITLTAVNDAPVAADVQLAANEDTALTITLGAYASDVDSATLTPVIVTGPAHGTLAQNADGSFTYTPDANYNGADSFTYMVSDGQLDSNVATVNLSITSVNDAPQGADNIVTTLEDAAYTFTVADFGFSDAADGNNLAAVHIMDIPLAGSLMLNGVAVTAGQAIGVADIAAGLLVFAPVTNANGMAYAAFTFQVQDDGGVTNGGVDRDPVTRTLTINVTPVNDAPVLGGQNLAATEDTPLTMNLLAAASDVDGDVLSPAIVAGPLHGQVSGSGPTHGTLNQRFLNSSFSAHCD